MIATNSFLRTASLGATAVLLALPGFAASESETVTPFTENYIKFSAAGMSTSGSKAAAQRRTQTPKVGSAGIEAFNYTRELSPSTTYKLDGQALPGAEDYLLQFQMTKNEVGSFEVGYKTFRTFYDGVGGFFPTNNAWLPLYARPLHVDRGQFFIGGTVALPKAPVFTVRFTSETRDGRKNSTILGDSEFTGVQIWSVSSLNPVSANRKILPAYMDLDEKQHTLEASVRHTFGRTTASLSLIGNRIDNLNTRTVDRYVGQLRPWPAIPTNPPSVIPPALSNNPNRGLDIQGVEEDAWTIVGRVETSLTETVSLYAGASYRRSQADITGSRLITLTLPSATGPISGIGGFTSGGRPPYSYTTAGTVDFDVYTANLGVNLKPSKTLAVDVGVKAEDNSAIAKNTATYVSTFMNQTTGAVAAPQRDVAPNWSNNKEKVWSPAVDARYTGIKNVSLFGSVGYRTSPGDERHVDTHVGPGPAGSSVVLVASGGGDEKVKEKHLNAKVGAQWAPSNVFTTRAELFSKDHENRFEGYASSAGGLYILDYDIVGARVTATVRPNATWSFTTRYVTQIGKTATTTELYAKGDSGEAERHSISETVTWVPHKSMYVQADATLVYDSLSTAYPEAGGLANDVLRNGDNNYWNGSLVYGIVIDKVTTAQLQGTYYKASNYEPAIAAATVPYGASGREYSVSLGLTRKLSDRWIAMGKIGYFDSRNNTLGGFADFHGPLGYVGVQHAF